jgi:hypothetical protein
LSGSAYDIRAIREQGDFLRAQREAWVARVRKVRADNPGLAICFMAERFSCTEDEIKSVLECRQRKGRR